MIHAGIVFGGVVDLFGTVDEEVRKPGFALKESNFVDMWIDDRYEYSYDTL